MNYFCDLIEKTAQPTISKRTRTAVQDLPMLLGQTFGELAAYVAQQGDEFSGPPFVIYYNMDMQDLDLEIGFPVSKVLPESGELKSGEIKAGKYASTIHIGPYDKIEPAYDALMKWVSEKGHEASGIAYEFYFSEPETPPEQIITQIMFQLK